MDCCFGGSRFSDDFCRDSNAGVWSVWHFGYNLPFRFACADVFLIMLVAVVVVFFAMVFLAKQSGLYNKIVLKDKQEAKDFDENVLQGLLGQTGVTHSTLRPFGVAEIDGKMVDVCSQGDFIDRDKKVQVVQITGKTVIVKVCEA